MTIYSGVSINVLYVRLCLCLCVSRTYDVKLRKWHKTRYYWSFEHQKQCENAFIFVWNVFFTLQFLVASFLRLHFHFNWMRCDAIRCDWMNWINVNGKIIYRIEIFVQNEINSDEGNRDNENATKAKAKAKIKEKPMAANIEWNFSGKTGSRSNGDSSSSSFTAWRFLFSVVFVVSTRLSYFICSILSQLWWETTSIVWAFI